MKKEEEEEEEEKRKCGWAVHCWMVLGKRRTCGTATTAESAASSAAASCSTLRPRMRSREGAVEELQQALESERYQGAFGVAGLWGAPSLEHVVAEGSTQALQNTITQDLESRAIRQLKRQLKRLEEEFGEVVDLPFRWRAVRGRISEYTRRMAEEKQRFWGMVAPAVLWSAGYPNAVVEVAVVFQTILGLVRGTALSQSNLVALEEFANLVVARWVRLVGGHDVPVTTHHVQHTAAQIRRHGVVGLYSGYLTERQMKAMKAVYQGCSNRRAFHMLCTISKFMEREEAVFGQPSRGGRQIVSVAAIYI
jgi:hypothetical protein